MPSLKVCEEAKSLPKICLTLARRKTSSCVLHRVKDTEEKGKDFYPEETIASLEYECLRDDISAPIINADDIFRASQKKWSAIKVALINNTVKLKS